MRGLGIAIAVLLALPAAASAQGSVAAYDGSIPFVCTLQQAGFEADVPDPGADPFCIEFDKRRQNVTELGIVDFLSKEPARVANASPKCFYFQRDHWRSSVVQDQGPAIYEWDGSYFFDKARGVGGVYVENFKVGGQTGDPTLLPGFPAEWKPYFGPGRGGVQKAGDVPADPSCGNKPAPGSPSGGSGGGGGNAGSSGPGGVPCRVPGGMVGRGIGGVTLGMRRANAKSALGAPATERLRYATWCFEGGSKLVAAFTGRGDRTRAQLVWTNSPPFDVGGVRTGSAAKTARRRMRGERRLARGVLVIRSRKRQLLIGLARSRVTYLAVAQPGLSRRGVLKLLRGA